MNISDQQHNSVAQRAIDTDDQSLYNTIQCNMSLHIYNTRALFQYPIWHLIVRFREISKPRDLCLELSDHSKIWQAPWQHCCREARQISKWCNHSIYQSRSFETQRDLTIKRLIGYWNGAQDWGSTLIRLWRNIPYFTQIDNLWVVQFEHFFLWKLMVSQLDCTVLIQCKCQYSDRLTENNLLLKYKRYTIY